MKDSHDLPSTSASDHSHDEKDHTSDNDASAPTKESFSSPSQPTIPPPPDGGYGWVCTFCCAMINAHTWGLNSSYGVFLAHYLRNNTFPGAGRLSYAFVGSLSISTAMLISPCATITTRKYGTRTTLFIGIVLECASLIGASFAKTIWQLFLSQGVAFGFGMGFLFVGSVGIPPQWFSKKRSFANAISASGSGFGGLVYSLAAGAMLQSIGLAWTFRVLGIVATGVNVICALLIRDRNKILNSRQNAFDWRLFKRAEYLLLCAYGWFSMLAYVVLIFSLANYANAIGLSASQGAVVSALLNLGQALGRPPIGFFSDAIGRINMAAAMTFLAGLFSFAIWIPATSYGVLIFFALIGGAVAGTFWATIGPVAAEITGLKYVPSALNLIWLVIVLPCTFSEPIALEIVSGTGSYLGTQLFVGFMYFAAAVCLVLLRGWKMGELDELARCKGSDGEEVDVVDTGALGEAMEDRARRVGRKSIWTEWWRWRKV
ncbi:unnamed protein product [Zymoseptoria tritici ST99CH_1A5]|uniref:Major facilitator superfamily (MFS) profile domain-containing protein n=4 Tax=Zymoseptoria tritici TaxID=1047171 RepID=F9WYK1_ZYMTI|nr:uncharacterized protein MYCGRDRAFT_67327 [Zymoseptoria tritici IPO323]SMQ46794.1 unnamed protein product [Zymoseptoria tritici ST99CH_3D7]SMR43154.1 unnamed protein product [Zymoseptoria tritici ST99CH_1E4]SMR45316.1 unnamed protein product [Zymoseptoria tritici ST99CH_3D1]SMY20477.1 unnamed protein product [Zymoseptoria tritici ST99CH_1A5]EGP91942.1 hypothetical protein MYCGRDRAFT_67327 [Zymoseptoria tritici IPO323]